jgi:hypothetical protein
VGQRREQLIPVTGFQWLRQAFGQLGHIDAGPEVTGQPLFPGGEAQEAAQRDEPAGSGGDGQRPPGALGAGAQPREVALITTQDVAVQFGDVGDASVAAGEITEPPQVTAVALDGAGRAPARPGTPRWPGTAADQPSRYPSS